MAEITRQRKGELIRRLFGILLKNPDGLRAKDALAQLAELVPPTEFEASYYPKFPNSRQVREDSAIGQHNCACEGWLDGEEPWIVSSITN